MVNSDLVAMVGDRHNLAQVEQVIEEFNVPLEYTFDYAEIAHDTTVLEIIKQKKTPHEIVRHYGQFIRWQVPNATALLSNIPDERLERTAQIIYQYNHQVFQDIHTLRFTRNKFKGNLSKRILKILNENLAPLNQRVQAVATKLKPHIEVSDAAKTKVSHLGDFDNQAVQAIAALYDLMPTQVEQAIQQGFEVDHIRTIASCWYMSPQFTQKLITKIPPHIISRIITAEHGRLSKTKADIVNQMLSLPKALRSIHYPFYRNDERKDGLTFSQVIQEQALWIQNQVAQAFISSKDILENGLKHTLFGYHLQLPQISIKKPEKILKKKTSSNPNC